MEFIKQLDSKHLVQLTLPLLSCFSSFPESKQKQIIHDLLQDYAIGSQEAREQLEMSNSQFKYHVENENITPIYVFNVHTNFHRYRVFLRAEIDRFSKHYLKYIHLYRKNRRRHQ